MPEPVGIAPTSSNGVVKFTVNCQIHLHSENGELKRSNSNIELIPTSGSQLPIMFPGTVSMVTNPADDMKNEKELTFHSTISVNTYIANSYMHTYVMCDCTEKGFIFIVIVPLYHNVLCLVMLGIQHCIFSCIVTA